MKESLLCPFSAGHFERRPRCQQPPNFPKSNFQGSPPHPATAANGQMSARGGQAYPAQFTIRVGQQRSTIAVHGYRFSLHENLSLSVVARSAIFSDKDSGIVDRGYPTWRRLSAGPLQGGRGVAVEKRRWPCRHPLIATSSGRTIAIRGVEVLRPVGGNSTLRGGKRHAAGFHFVSQVVLDTVFDFEVSFVQGRG